jgi:hypothetical protein
VLTILVRTVRMNWVSVLDLEDLTTHCASYLAVGELERNGKRTPSNQTCFLPSSRGYHAELHSLSLGAANDVRFRNVYVITGVRARNPEQRDT